MSEREELEAVIETAVNEALDVAGQTGGFPPFREKIADALISSGYTKGNGGLVEAVRTAKRFAEIIATGSAEGDNYRASEIVNICEGALSDSEGVATSCGDAGREEDALTGLREVLACVKSDGIPASLGVRLCPDQFNRYHPVVKKVAKAIEESAGDEISSAQAAIRTIWALGEPAARSAAQDTQRSDSEATQGDSHE